MVKVKTDKYNIEIKTKQVMLIKIRGFVNKLLRKEDKVIQTILTKDRFSNIPLETENNI